MCKRTPVTSKDMEIRRILIGPMEVLPISGIENEPSLGSKLTKFRQSKHGLFSPS